MSAPAAADAPGLVIAGAGAAGLGCALGAARAGLPVLLVERGPAPGGTVAAALIHTIGGLYDDAGEPLNTRLADGLIPELVERLQQADPRARRRRIGRTWVLNIDPARYREVIRDWLAGQPLLRQSQAAEITAVGHAEGHITGVTVQQCGTASWVPASRLVDATGDAALVRRLDPTWVEPGFALAGLVVVLAGVSPAALEFPRGVALIKQMREAVAAGALPAACATLWPDQGVADDEVYLKFNLSAGGFDPAAMDAAATALLAWLRRLPAFADARIAQRGELGVRDGGRIRGAYRLTEADLMAGRAFPDGLCDGCWPIEHWHPEQGVRLEYLPPGTRYQIPLGALTVPGLTGLYAAGKALCAEPRAQASARVAGTCWAMGAALGAHLAQMAR